MAAFLEISFSPRPPADYCQLACVRRIRVCVRVDCCVCQVANTLHKSCESKALVRELQAKLVGMNARINDTLRTNRIRKKLVGVCNKLLTVQRQSHAAQMAAAATVAAAAAAAGAATAAAVEATAVAAVPIGADYAGGVDADNCEVGDKVDGVSVSDGDVGDSNDSDTGASTSPETDRLCAISELEALRVSVVL